MDASIELRDTIVSCSAGLLLNGPITSVVDLNFEEERICKGNLVLMYSPNKKKICYMDLKNSKLQMEHYDELLGLAEMGCTYIADTMRRHLMQHYVSKLVTSH